MKGKGGPETHTACLLCQSVELRALVGYEKAGLVQCRSCRFVFSRFIPTLSQLISHYETYPRQDQISPITLKRYEELAAKLEPYATRRLWIDVGCGNGHLLSTVQKRGWVAHGTEFTDTAVELCKQKGISMQQGVLDTSHYQSGSFDVVSFIEVLEHINTPHDELDKFHSLLRQGGLLYITTPNFNSHARYLLKADWSIIEYPEHLCYYTPYTLDKLLTKHGFKKISLTTTGINLSRLFRKGQAEASSTGAKVLRKLPSDESLRSITDSNFLGHAIKRSVNGVLSLTSLGDTIKALYIKS